MELALQAAHAEVREARESEAAVVRSANKSSADALRRMQDVSRALALEEAFLGARMGKEASAVPDLSALAAGSLDGLVASPSSSPQQTPSTGEGAAAQFASEVQSLLRGLLPGKEGIQAGEQDRATLTANGETRCFGILSLIDTETIPSPGSRALTWHSFARNFLKI